MRCRAPGIERVALNVVPKMNASRVFLSFLYPLLLTGVALAEEDEITFKWISNSDLPIDSPVIVLSATGIEDPASPKTRVRSGLNEWIAQYAKGQRILKEEIIVTALFEDDSRTSDLVLLLDILRANRIPRLYLIELDRDAD